MSREEGNSRKADPKILGPAVEKVLQAGAVIIPPPHEIINPETLMEKFPNPNNQEEDIEMPLASGSYSPEIAKLVKEAEYKADEAKLLESFMKKRAQEAARAEGTETEVAPTTENAPAEEAAPTETAPVAKEGTPVQQAEAVTPNATEQNTEDAVKDRLNTLFVELDGLVAKGIITREQADQKMGEAVRYERTGVVAPNAGAQTENAPTKTPEEATGEAVAPKGAPAVPGVSPEKKTQTPEEAIAEAIARTEALKAQGVGPEGLPAGWAEKFKKAGAWVEGRAKNLRPSATEWVREVGNDYSKLPTKTKVAITLGLIAASGGSALIGGAVGAGVGTAALVGMTAVRMVGGAATFVAVERLLANQIEKGENAKERTNWQKTRHTGLAIAAGIIVGGGVLGHAIGAALSPDIEDLAGEEPATAPTEAPKAGGGLVESTPASDTLSGAAEREVTPNGQEALEAVAPAPVSMEHTVAPGDTLWKVLENKLAESGKLAGLSEAQKMYVIDTLKDHANPKDLGISSGDISNIGVGEKLNLTAILGNNELLEKTLTDAKGLSAEQLANIEAGGGNPTNPIDVTGIEETPTEAPVDLSDLEETPTESPVDVTGIEETPTQGTPTIETMANSAEVVKAFNADINELFGKKGFLGIGKVPGIESPHWADPNVGFANMRAQDAFLPRPSFGNPNAGIGIQNHNMHEKLVGYLKNTFAETNLRPTDTETVREYMMRAIGHNLAQEQLPAPEIVKPEAVITPEAPQVAPETSTTPQVETRSTVAPQVETRIPETVPGGTIVAEYGATKAQFGRTPDGALTMVLHSISVDRSSSEALFNDGWRQLARESAYAAKTGMNNAILFLEQDALDIHNYKQVLLGLEKQGLGNSPEASLVREHIANTIKTAEETYGNVFK